MSNSIENDPSPTTPGDPHQGRGVWWRLPLLLVFVLVAIVAARLTQTHKREKVHEHDQATEPIAADGKSVALNIEFANGRTRDFDEIPWHNGMTVDDLMTAASRQPDGINYSVNGNGEMMMLDGIDGVNNEWGGRRFWLYRVNGEFADRSLGIYELQPGDRVLWKFGEKE